MNDTIDLTAAIGYVSENGTILERARMLRMLMNVEPARESYQKLLDSQNPDGGFPSRPKPGSESAVDSTLTALWQFDELGMLDTGPARRALDFLRAVQRPDGGLDENALLPQHDLPPWIRPGELPTRLYLTTYAAYWLGVVHGALEAGEGHDDPTFNRAVEFIAAHQREDGAVPGYMHNNWLGASAFRFAGPAYAERAEAVLGYLLRLPPGDWADSQVAWALDCLTRAGLPADHPFTQFARAELIRRQAPDGSWASEDGPSFAASATVGVIKVLKGLGMVGGLDD